MVAQKLRVQFLLRFLGFGATLQVQSGQALSCSVGMVPRLAKRVPRCRASHGAILLCLVLASVECWTFVPPALNSNQARPAAQLSSHSLSEGVRRTSQFGSTLLLPFLVSAPAEAAEATTDDIPGALVAYGHYLALVLATACLTVERLTIKPDMTKEEETRMVIADSVYGLAGLMTVVTGYLRVTEYGKGWDFYQHEPLFWFKLTLVAIAGASSFFVTAMIVKRAIARRDAGDQPIAPVTPKLANRMTSIINAELLAIGSIPLTATLMARGVGYAEWLPWQAGAAPAVLALGGLGFKYIKEALDWTEDAEPNR
ncbi:unnamed protein product [Polarella glacialis]|uniref:Uncharacterized protein n=1 Tax=Polarella glacialis TaxID=89957 RepID=A0A813K2C4_POLGL|nr:unnamed protein product [Polarella glacialis]